MKILVAVKRVIDYNVKIRVKADHTDHRLQRCSSPAADAYFTDLPRAAQAVFDTFVSNTWQGLPTR